MVGTPGGWLLPGYDPLGTLRDRIGQEQLLELGHYLGERLRAQKQSDDLAFERVKTDRMVHWLAMLGGLGLGLQLLLGGSAQDRLHVAEENRRLDILP